jgi:xanthine dehydrogenase accessory factor
VGPDVHWLAAVERLRGERRAGVLVTLVSVRGHAPRDAGAKMVVTADDAWDSIGGGNLEATAVARARAMLADGTTAPEQISLSLNDKTRAEHGQQCCGGEVAILLEPLAVAPSVAIFGMGHVGLELARILSRHDIELHLVDSRADQVEAHRLTVLDDAVARVHVHHAPVPELVLGQVPRGTHVLVMTHDHAEDAALCDTALRCGHLASIGLIGSSAKWSRFRQRLAAEGHPPADLERITTPIGLPGLTGKEPATIAVSVAAALVGVFEAERSAAVTAAHEGVTT